MMKWLASHLPGLPEDTAVDAIVGRRKDYHLGMEAGTLIPRFERGYGNSISGKASAVGSAAAKTSALRA